MNNVDKVLNEIASQSGVDLAVIKNKYDELVKQHGSELKALINLKRSVTNRVAHDYKPYKFYPIAILKPVTNIFERMREKALRLYNENPKKAVIDGYVMETDEGKIIPLDYRKYVFGQENKHYGQPLEGDLYVAQYLIAIKNEEWKTIAIADVRSKDVNKVSFQLGNEYEAWIKILESDKSEFPYARISLKDVRDLGFKLYSLKEWRSFLQGHKLLYEWTEDDRLRFENVDKIAGVLGFVSSLRTTSTGKLYFTLNSIEYFLDWEYFVFPRTFDIFFAEDTGLIVIGKFKYDAQKNLHSVNAYGVIALKDSFIPLTEERLAIEEAKMTTPL